MTLSNVKIIRIRNGWCSWLINFVRDMKLILNMQHLMHGLFNDADSDLDYSASNCRSIIR
jgi:hypothetical protein